MSTPQSALKQLDASGSERNGKPGIEEMFFQIMTTVQKSVSGPSLSLKEWIVASGFNDECQPIYLVPEYRDCRAPSRVQ